MYHTHFLDIPEVEYLFQGRVCGEGSLLAKPSGPLGTLLAWRALFWACMTIGHITLCEECGMCSRPGVWQWAESLLSLRCVPTESVGLNLLFLTKLPGTVLPSNTCKFHDVSFFFFFNSWVIILHCVKVSNFLYPYFGWGISRLFLVSGTMNKAAMNIVGQVSLW